MKKNTIITLVLFLFFSIGSSTIVFANVGFSEIWTVKGDKQTTKYDNFGWDETPWLYVKLSDAPGLFWNSSVTSDWLFDNALQGESDNDKNLRSYWLDLSTWDTARQPGEWTIEAAFTYSKTGYDTLTGSGFTTFNVNGPVVQAIPEPLSFALLITGGLIAFAATKLLKKKAV